MDKKYLVLPGALVAAGVVMGAINLWPDPREELRERNRCMGLLSKETADLFDDGEGGRVIDEDNEQSAEQGSVPDAHCSVYRKAADGRTRLHFTLTVESGKEPVKAEKGATPIGDGRSGWVTLRSGAIHLPESCGQPSNPEARYVSVSAWVYPSVLIHEDWNEKSVIPKIRTILTESADNLAKQYDCA